MQEMSSGAALRQLQQAHAGLKKARQLLKQARDPERAVPSVFEAGWESLSRCHRLMAGISLAAVDDAVLPKQLAVQRSATALLVRLRRLHRQDRIGPEGVSSEVDQFGDEDLED
jgi:hypothetical protein